MRTLILITLLFKVQINIASEVGNLNPTCWNGKGCLSDSHCGENGICKFSPMTLPGKPQQSSTSPGQQPVKSGEGYGTSFISLLLNPNYMQEYKL